jgi:hypothetical protein
MLSDSLAPQTISRNKPLALFREALLHSQFHRWLTRLTGGCFCLSDLDETLKGCPVEASYYAGIKTVSIEKIRGTQGKADEFDAEFNPTQERSRSRWIGVAWQKLLGRDLPPVDLVQVDDMYYVRDGHHRISVSRALGQNYIDAEVTIMRLQQRTLIR